MAEREDILGDLMAMVQAALDHPQPLDLTKAKTQEDLRAIWPDVLGAPA